MHSNPKLLPEEERNRIIDAIGDDHEIMDNTPVLESLPFLKLKE